MLRTSTRTGYVLWVRGVHTVTDAHAHTHRTHRTQLYQPAPVAAPTKGCADLLTRGARGGPLIPYWVRTPYWGHLKGDRLLGKDSSPSCDSSVEVLTRVLNVGLRLGEPETNAARCTRCQAAAARAGPERSSSAPDEGGHQRSSKVIRGNLGRRDPRAHLMREAIRGHQRSSEAIWAGEILEPTSSGTALRHVCAVRVHNHL